MWLLSVAEELRFRQGRSPITLVNYEVALKRWRDAGVRSVEDVTVSSVQAYVEKRLARVQVQSVATEYIALMAVVAHLERTGRFPTARLEELRRCAPRVPRRQELTAPFLAASEVDEFCSLAGSGARLLVRLACLTGLRASELARLEWSDVDLHRKMLHVRRGKTGARRVPLCQPAIDLLRPLVSTGHVFGGVGSKQLQQWVREARAASGVRVTLTLCRHTRASWWVQAGVPLAKVAKWLGHSVGICARHYAGLGDTYDPAAELGAAG